MRKIIAIFLVCSSVLFANAQKKQSIKVNDLTSEFIYKNNHFHNTTLLQLLKPMKDSKYLMQNFV